MPKLSETELLMRDAERDLNAELLEAMTDMRAGAFARKTEFIPQPDGGLRRVVTSADGTIERDELLNATASVRLRSGLSQARFAELMGISVRTLQDWEQGRRAPSGAAKTLLQVAERHPEALREIAQR
ncbi:MAG: helix-turn-helix domain-containing protein [Methylomicrobium sp.]